MAIDEAIKSKLLALDVLPIPADAPSQILNAIFVDNHNDKLRLTRTDGYILLSFDYPLSIYKSFADTVIDLTGFSMPSDPPECTHSLYIDAKKRKKADAKFVYQPLDNTVHPPNYLPLIKSDEDLYRIPLKVQRSFAFDVMANLQKIYKKLGSKSESFYFNRSMADSYKSGAVLIQPGEYLLVMPVTHQDVLGKIDLLYGNKIN